MNCEKLKRIVNRVLGASLLCSVIAGCAGVAPAVLPKDEPAPDYEVRSENVKNGFDLTEETEIDSELKADFEAGVKALNNGEVEKGIALLEKVTKASPRATAPYINLAIAYTRTNKLELAEKELNKALNLNPEHPVANNEYGMVYRKTGRFAEAKALYEKILEKYPNFQPARKNLGVLCDLYLRDPECALNNYLIYSAAVPDDKPVTIWVTDLKQRLGK